MRKQFILFLSVALLTGIFVWGLASRSVFAQTTPVTTTAPTAAPVVASEKQISASAILLDGKGTPVPNGEYQVRFGIYRTNRIEADPYPSDTDSALRVWEEVQTVTVKNGIMNAYLGATTAFPGNLTFEGGEYFLGIRVGTDSEMIPRKKFGTFTNAINSQFLRGRMIGENAGDIVTYDTGGKINIKKLPTGTSGSKLLLANNKDFTGLLSDVSGLSSDVSNLQGDSHAQNTDTGTTSLSFNLGSDTAVSSNNFDLSVSSATDAPTLRYNGTAGEWQFSDDGTTFTALGAGSGSGNTIVAGNGISVVTGSGTSTLSVDATTSGTTATLSSNSGLEAVAGGLRMLGGCADGQVLSWNAGTSVWECADKTGGTSDWTARAGVPPYTYLTDITSDLVIGGSAVGEGFSFDTSAGTLSFEGSSADANEAILGAINPTADRTLNLPNVSGVIATVDGGQTFTNATWNATAIGVGYGGTGVATLASNGVLYGNGAGAVQVTSAGTSAQFLVANGAGVPTFVSMSGDATITNAGVLTVGANAITTGKISDGTIFEADLNVTNGPTAGYILSYDAGGGFTWISGSAVGLGDITAVGTCTSDACFTDAATTNDSLYFEGATADGFEIILQGADATLSDKTITLPDATGTVITTGNLTGITAVGTVASGTWNGGTIGVPYGGTGATTLTTNGVLYGNSTGAVGVTAAGTSAQFLVANGAGVPTFVSMSGDATITNAGVLTIGANAVTTGKISDGTILEADLNVTNSPTNGYILSYDSGSTGFTWVSSASVGLGDITAVGDCLTDACFVDGTNNTLTFEGTSVDGNELVLQAANPTSDQTITLPDATGTVITTGNLTGITAVGTVASGTWNGGTIGVGYGGTGATSLTSGGILYGGGAGAIGALSVMTNGQLLIGDGSGAPTLATLTDGTGITITEGAGSITIESTLGTAIDTSEITDNTLLEADIAASNAPSDGQVLTYNNGTGGFTWTSSGTGGIGDITAVGNVTDGPAFDGTAGTQLIFNDAEGDGTLTMANLSLARQWTLPDETGTICTTGSVCSGYQASIGYTTANAALSNLASVAINTSLISDADNTDDLGSASNSWKDVYTRTVKLDGSTSGTITLQATGTAGSNTITLPASTGTVALTSDLHSAVTLAGSYDYLTLSTQQITLGQIDLTTDVTGILPVANGGTGVNASTVADGQILIGHDANNNFSLATLSDGTGVTVTEGAGTITIASTLGTAIDTTEITDSTIAEADLDVANSPTLNYILSYNGSNFTWISNTGGSGASKWTDSGSITYLTETGDGLAIGGSGADTSKFYFDVSTGNQIVFEGTTDNSYETTFVITDPDTIDKTITFPNLTGTVALLGGGQTFTSATWNATAIGVGYGGTGLTGTPTNGQLPIGNGSGYTLATITAGNGIAVTNGAGSITPEVSLLTTVDGDGGTSSNSGLEFQGTSTNKLALLQGCADGQVLEWNNVGNVWQCADKTAGTSDWTAVGGSPGFTYLTDTASDLVLGSSTTDSGFFFDVSASTVSFEGATANGFETALGVIEPTADNVINLPNASGTIALNPMTTQGDIIYGGTSGTSTRLAGAGVDNYVLKYDLDTNTPFWGSETGGTGASKWTQGTGFAYLTTTTDDLVVGATTTTAPFFFDTSAGKLKLGLNGTSGSLDLYSEVGVTDYTLSLQPSSGMTQSTTYTFPTAYPGGNGYILAAQTDGTMSWISNTGGSGASKWSENGALTYLTQTTYDLAVGGNTLAAPFSVDISANTARIGSGATANAVLTMYGSDGDTGSITYSTDDRWLFEGGAVELRAANALVLGEDAATNTAGSVKFFGAGANNYYTTISAGTQTGNVDYTLPTAAPGGNGYILAAQTDGTMSWISNTGGSGASKWSENGTITYLTQTTYDLALGGSTATESPFFFDVSASAITFEGSADGNETILGIENPDADQTLNLPDIAGASATIATINGGQTFSSAIWNGTTIGVGYGGTGATSTPTNGQLLIGNGSAYTVANMTSTGASIAISNGAGTINLESSLGTSVSGSEIVDNTIEEVDLEATNSPSDGQVLTYSNSTGGFTWTSSGSGGIGDITSVGNVSSGAAFDGTVGSGTQLIFYDAEGNGTLTFADITGSAKTWTLPNATGTILSTGNFTDITGVGTVTSGTWSGNTVTVSYGGTGATSFTSHGVLYGNTASAIGATAAGTDGQLFLGVTSGAPAFASMSGDATITNAGVLTVGTGAITSGKILDSTVAEVDLSVTNSAVAGYILSYDSGGGFTWIANTGGSGASKWSENGSVTYLTQTSYDLVLGANASTNAPFFFDVSADTITFEGTTADAYETTLGVVDPSGTSKTLNLPNVSGVIATVDGSQTFTLATWNAGTIAVGYGGTGATSFTTNGVLYGNSASAIQVTSAGTSGQVLVANSSGVPTFVSMSGDVNVSDLGVATIQANAIGTSEITNDTILEADLTASNSPTDGQVLTYNNSTGGFTWTSSGSGGIGDITSIGNVTSGAAFDGTAGSGSQIVFYDAEGNGTLTFADITVSGKTWTLPNETGTICTTGSVCSGYQASLGYTAANAALSNLSSVAINTSLISDADNTDDLGSASNSWKDVYTRTVKLDGSTSGTITLQATATAGSNTITLPASTGTVALTSDLHNAVTLAGAYDYLTLSTQQITLGQIDLTTDVTGVLPVANGGTGLSSTPINGQLLIGNGSGYTLATLTAGNGVAITNGAGTISIVTNILNAVDGTSGVTSSYSGLEFQGTSSNQLSLIQGCANDQVLAWDETNSIWECSDKTAGTSDWTALSTPTRTYLTDTGSDLALGGSTSTSSRFYFDVITGNQIVFEGTGADDANETTLVITNPTADNILTLPNITGTLVTTGDTGSVTGTMIANDTVALTTDTAGSYISAATASGGLTVTTAEGGTVGILLQPSTDALSSNTSSGSGMELLATGLSLLQGCANNEVLAWNETSDVWTCTTVSGIGGANTALSNLASVAINASLIPGAAGTLDLGSTTYPWHEILLSGTSGTPGTNQYKITGASTGGLRTITFPDASGTVALTTDLHNAVTISDTTTIDLSLSTQLLSADVVANSIGDTQLAYDTGQNLTSTSTPTFQTLALGYNTADGSLALYSEQGGTDYTATLLANTTMSSNASFYLPADEPAATYLLNMTSGGVIGFDTNTYATTGQLHTQNTDTGTTGVSFIIGSGADSATTNTTLQFGNTNSESLYFDGASTDNFKLSDDLDVTGGITTTLASTFGGVAAYDPISISPVAIGSTSYTGTITSVNLDTAARTWTFPDASGTVVTTGNLTSITATGTISSGTWNGTDIALADGGTNRSLTASAGSIVYSDADSFELTAVGNAGECLTSNAAGAPTWTACTTASNSPFTAATGVITKVTAGDRLSLLYGDAADTQLTIENTTNNVIPTIDAAVIDLTGNTTGIVTDGADILSLAAEFGNGTTNTNSGLHINIDPVNTPSGDEIFYAVNIDGLSAGTSATETAISVGANWDTILDSANLDISGAGVISGATGITSSGTITFSALGNDGAEATAVLINASNQLVYRELGTLAFSSASLHTQNTDTGTDGTNFTIGDGTTTFTIDTSATNDTITIEQGTYDSILSFTQPGAATQTYTFATGGTVCTTGSVCAGYQASLGYTAANVALSNLASVAINASLIPGAAGTLDLGSTTYPWHEILLSGTSGTPGTNQFKITGASTGGLRTITLPDASGTIALTANKLSVFAATTSAELSGVLSDENTSGGYMTDPMTTAGDLIIGGASGVPARLADVAVGSCLISGGVGVAPSWGSCGGVADDSLDFVKFEDTLDLDDNLILNQTAYTWTQNFTGTTTTGYTYNANSLTTGTGMAIASTSADGDGSKLLSLTRTGTNGAIAKTNYGLYATIANTNATSGTNIAGYFSATGANMSNYGLVVAAGNSGFGTTTPVSLAEVYSSSANPVFTLTGAHATDYDPYLAFRTDASPTVKFSLGVDASNDYFKIYSGDGIGDTSEFMIDTTGVTTISQLKVGAQSFEDDAGAVVWTDMNVTSASSDNTVESYVARIDGQDVLTIYALVNGAAGAVDTVGVGIGTTTPTSMLHVTNAITTGTVVNITDTAASQTTSTLLNVAASGYTTGYTGDVASFTGVSTTGAANVVKITSANTTNGSGLNITANGVTTGTAFTIPHTTSVIANGGSLARISSTSVDTSTTTGVLLDLSSTASTAGTQFLQTYSGLTTGTGESMVVNALAGGTGLAIASSATALTGSLESITLSGSNSNNTGNLLYLNSSGANSVAKALNVAIASTGNFSTTGGVNFTFSGAHTGTGFAVSDATATGKAMTITANSISTGTALEIASTSTVGDGSKLLNLTRSGTNSTSGKTNYGVYSAISTTNSTSGTNVAGYFSATSADSTMSNYGLLVAAGSVGIGTATPTSLLEMYGTASADGIFTLTSPTASYDPLLEFRTGATPAVQFTLGVDTSDSNVFKIDSATGLGTSPDFKIDTTGVTTIANVKLGAQSFPEDGGILSWTDMSVTSSSADNTVMSYSAQIDSSALLTIYALSDGAGSIDNKGVGIGTTAPGYMLDVYDDTATDYAARIFNDGNNANRYGLVIQAGADDASGTTYYLNALDGDGGQVGYIANTTGTFALTDPSDIRTKTNIENTLVGGLDVINQLRVVDFNRLSNPDGPRITGFIAQEVQEVYPNVISVGENGYLGIAKTEFIPLLVKAIQEEDARVTNVESSIGSLNLSTGTHATTLADLQTSINNQLTVISETENGFEIRLKALEAERLDLTELRDKVTTLEGAVSLLQSSNEVLLDFYNALNLGSVLSTDADGNLDLSNGKIRAKELSTGALAIEIVDDEAPSIGSGILLPKARDEKGAKDADGNDIPDGLDDTTGDPMGDPGTLSRTGYRYMVKTKAVGAGSRIFITPKRPTAEPLAVTAVTAGEGFTVELKNETSEEIPFDWIVVEEK